MKPGIMSVAAISRYGAKCPEFKEAWHQLQCMIDVEHYDAIKLAELVDYVIDHKAEEKRIRAAQKKRGA